MHEFILLFEKFNRACVYVVYWISTSNKTLNWIELNWIEMWIELKCELNWIELHWIVNWIELNRIWIEYWIELNIELYWIEWNVDWILNWIELNWIELNDDEIYK